jgi:mannose/fructose/N-acetylgalactosamine-specific phosphotransferase system component IID
LAPETTPSPGTPVDRADAPRLVGAVGRRVFWRCLTLQASWNEQRLQNLGLLAALAPWLRRLQLTPAELRGVCRRYFGFFNTNPYLAGFVVGGLLHLEQARHDGRPVADRQVVWFRDALARACGALGDQLFWLGLRPALMLLACLLAALGRWELVLGLIGGFAAGQLWWRRRTLAEGFARGTGVVEIIGRAAWHRTIAWAQRAALGLTGLLIGVYFAGVVGLGDAVGTGRWLGLICVGFALPSLVRQQSSAEVQLLLGLGCLGVLALILP